MAIIASFFLSWLGFYLVKGSVMRDRETGVGQIMASTPLTRPVYVFGKWLSNLSVFISMLIVLVIAAIAIQFFAAESQDFQFGALLAPFIFIALPMLALTAALAVLFETIGFLQGGLGNVIYFFIYLFIFPLSNTLSKVEPALEPLGFGLLEQSMGAAAKAAFPDYAGGFVLGSSDIPIKGIFTWSGVAWNTDLILKRFAIFGIAMAITLIASLFFDRFDPSRYRPRQVRKAAQVPETAPAAGRAPLTAQRLSPIEPTRPAGFGFGRILISELKLLSRVSAGGGMPWRAAWRSRPW